MNLYPRSRARELDRFNRGHAVVSENVRRCSIESCACDLQIAHNPLSRNRPRLRRAQQACKIEGETLEVALHRRVGKQAELFCRGQRKVPRSNVGFYEERPCLFRQGGLQINRRTVERPHPMQRHSVLANVRGIDVDQLKPRLLIQHHIAQGEIAILVTGCASHAGPLFACHQLQQSYAQRTGGARIQIERYIFGNEIVRRIAHDHRHVVQARSLWKNRR